MDGVGGTARPLSPCCLEACGRQFGDTAGLDRSGEKCCPPFGSGSGGVSENSEPRGGCRADEGSGCPRFLHLAALNPGRARVLAAHGETAPRQSEGGAGAMGCAGESGSGCSGEICESGAGLCIGLRRTDATEPGLQGSDDHSP